jgi:hypothetical protein
VAVSGDTVVVGAFGEKSNATGINGNESDNSAHLAGAAYVFTGLGPGTTHGSTNCCSNCRPPYSASYNVTVFPGDNYLVNHLCHGTNNFLAEILPVAPEGTVVRKWNNTAQGFIEQASYVDGIWDYNSGGTQMVLAPGEGFVLSNPGAAFTITFTGCEPDCGPPCEPLSGFSLVGRIGIGTATYTNLFSCPPVCGTQVRVWNPTNQVFSDFDYVNGAWTPQAPLLAVGHSAFVAVLANTNCCTNSAVVICAGDKTVPCGSAWHFDPPTVSAACCSNLVMTLLSSNRISDEACRSMFEGVWQVVNCDGDVSVCTQRVTVVDTTPPLLVGCTNIVITSGVTANGALVNYAVTATDNCDPNPLVNCVPPPGLFPVGQTLVICTAVDRCLNTNICEFTVTVHGPVTNAPCWTITNEVVTCTATNGIYLYTFCATNGFSGPVSYLTLLNPPPGVTFTPDVLPLAAPLQPGQGGCFTVAIQVTGEAPGELCFRVGAHNTNFAQCCVTEHCLTLPQCCVAVIDESAVAVPGQPNCYDYTFSIRNETVPPVSIQYLILVPDPPNSGASVTPDILFLSTPLLPGQTVTRTVRLCVPAAGGSPCFTLSVHDTNFNRCCSIRHCLPETLLQPHDPAPVPPSLTAVLTADNHVRLSLQTTPGVTYRFESISSPAAPDWILLQSVVGDGSVQTVTDSTTNGTQRFYRVRSQ